MNVRLSLAVASHISDAQHELHYNPDQASTRLRFVKILIFENSDLSEEVTTDYLDSVWAMAAGIQNTIKA